MVADKPIHVGTSGWHYDHWHGPFYPEDLPQDDRLAHYAQHLSTVEINNTFYQLPEKETVANWRETTPADFIFAVKASRYITHQKNLKDPEESIGNFMARIGGLKDKLGPVLFQLPPQWHVDKERLDNFLRVLPGGLHSVFEFRHESWFDDDVYALLADHGAACCIYDLEGEQTPKVITADHIYVRLHGPGDEAYAGNYDRETLEGWAETIAVWNRSGKTVYCYFNNDQDGHAINNALFLKEKLAEYAILTRQ